MENIDRYLTPCKLGRPVLGPSGVPGTYNERAVDCPFVFTHNGMYYMLHVGFDGRGYQTALSTSGDLLHWSAGRVLFPRGGSGGWDGVGVAGMWILRENDLNAPPRLKKWDGKYWMVYHSYPGEGYESGPAQIGLAFTDDETLLHWTRLPEPILSWRDGGAWERGGLYKGCLVEEGGVFYLFYNAKQRDRNPWNEQIGLATSRDLVHWERFDGNPVIPNGEGAWDCRFCADPCVMRDGDRWVMFYYGYNGRHAGDGAAFSRDLVHWEKWPEPLLTSGGPGSIDTFHAHKPSVITKDGVLCHFYCAVRESRPGDPAANRLSDVYSEYRCVTLASGREL